MRKKLNLNKGLTRTVKSMTSLSAKSKKKPIKNWWNKLSKTDKNIIKGTAFAVGTIALIGAGGEIAKKF